MKNILVLMTILLCYFLSSSAQDNTKKEIKNFKVWISLNNNSRKFTGALYETKDSSILVSDSYFKSDYSADKFKISEINYKNINFIQTRNKNSIKNRVLIGTISGIFTGAFLGFIDGDDPPNQIMGFSAGRKAVAGAIIGGWFGSGVGALIGTFKLEIPINGEFEKFNINRHKLKKRSFQ